MEKCKADWRKAYRKNRIAYRDEICEFCNDKVEWIKDGGKSKGMTLWTSYKILEKKQIYLCRACDVMLYRLENYYDKFNSNILRENYDDAKAQVLLLKWLMEEQQLNDGFVANGWKYGQLGCGTTPPRWIENYRIEVAKQAADGK